MRARALAVLRQVEERKAFAAELLGPDDAPFVRELVLGVLRRQLTVDTVYAAYGKRPLHSVDVIVRLALRLGIYQLLFLDGVPPHAAVSESVALVGHRGQRAYVNGTLRTLQRELNKVPLIADRGGASPTKRFQRSEQAVFFFSRAVFPDPAEDLPGWLGTQHSHPPWLVRRWLAEVGEDATVARLRRGNQLPALELRPRHGRCDAEQLAAKLAAEGLSVERVARSDGADRLAVPGAKDQGKALRSKAFAAGLFSVQDPRQADAVELLAPRPGEVVWDACAAPGGKATQLAELLEGDGHVVASDVSAGRLKRVTQNAARLGLTDTLTVAAHDLLGEGTPPGRPAAGFDAILLDAPCSNTAVLDRRPEARWRLTPETPAELAAQQARLIDAARAHLRPGGRLVYSVCSYEPEEGVGQGLKPTRSPFVFVEGGDDADGAGDRSADDNNGDDDRRSDVVDRDDRDDRA